jgi:hypothetical protein
LNMHGKIQNLHNRRKQISFKQQNTRRYSCSDSTTVAFPLALPGDHLRSLPPLSSIEFHKAEVRDLLDLRAAEFPMSGPVSCGSQSECQSVSSSGTTVTTCGLAAQQTGRTAGMPWDLHR